MFTGRCTTGVRFPLFDMVLISLKLLLRCLCILCAHGPVVAYPYKELAYANSGLQERAFNLRISAQRCARTHFHAFMNLAGIFNRVGLTKFVRGYLRRHLRKCSRMMSIVSGPWTSVYFDHVLAYMIHILGG